MHLGVPEIILVLAVALFVFGPKRIPRLGADLRESMNEWQRQSQQWQNRPNKSLIEYLNQAGRIIFALDFLAFLILASLGSEGIISFEQTVVAMIVSTVWATVGILCFGRNKD